MNNKTLYWIIGILILINVAALSALWFNKPWDRRGSRDRGKQNKEHYLKQSLDLNDEQSISMEELRKTLFNDLRQLRAQETELKMQLLEEAFASSNDSTSIRMRQELGNLIIKEEELLANHFKEVIKILSPEQSQKFKEMTKKYLNRKSGKRRNKSGRSK